MYLERQGALPAGEVLKALYSASLPIRDVETRRSRLEEVMLRVLHAGAQ